MKKKLFTLLLAVAAGIGTMNADIVDGTCGDNLTWSLNTKDSTLTITGSGEMTSTPSPWADYKSYIKYVSLPDGLTSIIGGAFEGCSGLTSVTIPNIVTNIGFRAFSGCNNLPIVNGIRYADTYLVGVIDKSLSSYSIKEDTRWIGDWAFSNCTALTSITIPNAVIKIGAFAFEDCRSLTSFCFPNSVTYVDWEGMFEGCTNLTSLTIGKGLENINAGFGAFGGCENLANIEVVSGNPRYDSRNNCNAVIETSSNALVLGGTNTTIPNGVTSIKEAAFVSRQGLRSIVIPSSVATIEEGAFYGCSGLLSITNYATTPQNITEDVFSGTDEYPGVAKLHCKLYVPENSIPMYKVAIGWRDFAYIEAIEASEDIENTSIEPKTSKIIRDGQIIIERNDKTYTLTGQEVK